MQKLHAFLLGLILFLAAGLRWYSIDTHSYWTDEFCSLSDAMGWGLQLDQVPLDQPVPPIPVCTRLASARPIAAVIPAIARTDVHPPVYFFLLRLWIDCFGDSEKATRSLGIVTACAGIAGLFVAAKATVGPEAAFRAALVAAVAVSSIEFSQEVRNYLLATTLVVAAAWCLIQVGRNPTPVSTAFFALSLLSLPLTHYYAAASAAALCLHGVITFRDRARRAVVVAMIVSGPLFLMLWGPSLWNQLHHLGEHNYWLKDDGPGRIGRLVERSCRLPVRYVIDTETFGLPPVVTAIIGGAILIALPFLYCKRPNLRLWVLLAAAPIAEIALLDLVGRTAELSWVRYSLFASPAFFVLIAAAVTARRWSTIPTIAAVAAALLSLQTAYTPVWKVTDFGTLASFADRSLKPGDALVVTGPDSIGSAINVAAFQHYMTHLPNPTIILTRPASPAVLEQLRRSGAILIVADSHGELPNSRLAGFVTDSTIQSGGVIRIYQGHLPKVLAANK